MCFVLERRSIAGYATEGEDGNSQKEQTLCIQDYAIYLIL